MTQDGIIQVQMIPVEHINVVNPRGRAQKKFQQIIPKIGKSVLKSRSRCPVAKGQMATLNTIWCVVKGD